jgi:hypothetical protein
MRKYIREPGSSILYACKSAIQITDIFLCWERASQSPLNFALGGLCEVRPQLQYLITALSLSVNYYCKMAFPQGRKNSVLYKNSAVEPKVEAVKLLVGIWR